MLTLACSLLLVMFVLLTVVSARGHSEDDPESALRIILAIVELCGAVVLGVAATQGGSDSGGGAKHVHATKYCGDPAAAVAVSGATDLEDPTSPIISALHISTLSTSITRVTHHDHNQAGPQLDDKCSSAALMREKLRVESKLREARRLVDQLTSTLNILHYCAPLSPRRPFALTSLPRGESLLAILPATDFEPLHSVVSRLNQEMLARCIAQPSAAIPNPLPVVWQQLRDVERLLLHPVALELVKSFLLAQPVHPAFPAVEPVAAVMLILDAHRLHVSESTALAKLVAQLLSCYLSHCDESPAPHCSLPLSGSLLSRFVDAVRLWKLASGPQSTATVSSAELLATVVTLFGEAAVECTQWLALLYLPGFQRTSANKLAIFCVGHSQVMGENAERPTAHTRTHHHVRQHSDPKTTSSMGSLLSTNPNQSRPPIHAGARRSAGDVSPGGSRQRIHLHLSPTPPPQLRRGSSMEEGRRSTDLPVHLDSHYAVMFKPVTPPPEGAVMLSPLSPSPTPPKSNSPSRQLTQQLQQQQQQPPQLQPQGRSSPGQDPAVTGAAAPTVSNLSSIVASPSGSPLSLPLSSSGAFSTFRLPNTMNHSPALSLRKAVLIAAQEIVTPSFQTRTLGGFDAAGNPPTMALASSPLTPASTAPVSPSPPPNAAPADVAIAVSPSQAQMQQHQQQHPAGEWQL